MRTKKKITSLCIVSLFLAAIFCPLVISVVEEDRDVSATEKRTLAQLPVLPTNLDAFEQYPRDFEKYFNDQFGMREMFLSVFSRLKMSIGDSGIAATSGAVPEAGAIKGKDGWYFLNRVWDGDPVSDYRNISLYSETDLLRAVLLFEARNQWLKERGIRYLLFFAPNKHTIYSEYLPDYIVKQGDISSMDQLYDALARYTTVEFVDLRKPLREGKTNAHYYWKDRKTDAALYYKTDSHWNAGGADIAQYAVAKRIEQMFPGRISPARRDPEEFSMVGETGDIGRIMGRDDLPAYGPTVSKGTCSPATLEELEQRQLVTTCEKGDLNALIFHDSFYTIPLKAFFADYFARTTFLWESMSQWAVMQQLKKGNIDLVIEERAERFLPFVPALNSGRYDIFWRGLVTSQAELTFVLDKKDAAVNTERMSPRNIRLLYNREEDELEILAASDSPGLTISNIPFEKDTLYVLLVDISSPAQTRLTVSFATAGAEGEKQDTRDSQSYSVREGSNKLYIPIFSANLGHQLRFEPGAVKGVYRLRQFEIREIDPSILEKIASDRNSGQPAVQ